MYKQIEFDFARDALKYVINYFSIKELYIPYYLCDVIRHSIVETGCKPFFYHIDNNFYPQKDFSKSDYILYPNYWGVCTNNVQKLEKNYPNLIVDNAHAYFNKPSGIAAFNAGHKFGYKKSKLWIRDNSSIIIKNMYDNKKISDRKEKFLKLHNEYKDINMLDIDTNSVPFCYPCLVDTIENADNLVSKLSGKGKLIYRYWNLLPKNYPEYKFYSRLVAIPIE